MGGLKSTVSYLLSIPSTLATSYRFLNTVTNARCNISAHYDISNQMFQGLCRTNPASFVTDQLLFVIAHARVLIR